MIKRTFIKVEEFKSLLAINFDSMQADRISCYSDSEFWAKYWVSGWTVRKYMWVSWKNNWWLSSVNLDIEEVNAMREKHSDWYVAKHYWCTTQTIRTKCGSRKNLDCNMSRFPKENLIVNIDSVKSINARLEKETKVIKKEDRWEYPEETPYWMTSNIIISGDAPMAGIKFEKNIYGHPY